jgi:5-methylcytosine-specific restriction protein B
MPDDPPTEALEQALDGFDRASIAEALTEAEAERKRVLEQFPVTAWPELPLERYALGQEDSEETYCRWLEFRTPYLGSIRGGIARKLIIYKHRNKPGWYFDEATFESVEAAWTAVRAAFVRAIELAAQSAWEEIDALTELRSGPALVLKTLHIYYPSDVLPVYSQDHLRRFLRILGSAAAEDASLGPLALNRRLLAELRSSSELADWHTIELMNFLYERLRPPAHRIVKIAPGEGAKYWDECLQGGYICVSWDEIGDLREYESKEDFQDAFLGAYLDEYNNQRNVASKKANEVWTLRELDPGDLVVANRGTTEVLAVGTVVEPGYVWDETRSEYRHTVRVDWDTTYAQTIPAERRWAFVTVAPIPERLRSLVLRRDGAPPPPPPADPLLQEIADVLERKGQAILYGPPGTGKTFHAGRFAVWWLASRNGRTGVDVLGDPEDFKRVERELGRGAAPANVWWIVANPSEWSWDRLFADGRVVYRQGRLRRNYALVKPGDLVVGYQATPQKRVVALARVQGEFGAIREDGQPGLPLEPVTPVANGPVWEEISADPVLATSEPVRFRNQGTLFRLSQAEGEHVLSLLAERDPAVADALGGAPEEAVGELTRVTFHPSYAYEDFVEALRPVAGPSGGGFSLELVDGVFKRVCAEARATPERSYLILVDEINRANVARVFGELITLLERDKRGVEVVLPQSREIFSVPPNVFVLGTMNTADRSIRLLDAALRRRFGFVELMPNVELLEGERIGNLPLDEFLTGLNERIARAHGREKQIGHSFFLHDGRALADADAFARVIRHEIVPLLQEYCFDDYGQLVDFLGPDLVDLETLSLNHEALADSERLIAALERHYRPAA